MTFYSFPSARLPHSKNRHVPYQPRLKWGLTTSLFFATAVSIWACLVALLRRQFYFPQYHANLLQIVAAYYVAGLLCGLALGFLYPLLDRRWGAVALGFLLGFLSYGTIAVTMVGFHAPALWIALIAAVLIGGGLGLVEFDEAHKSDLPAA